MIVIVAYALVLGSAIGFGALALGHAMGGAPAAGVPGTISVFAGLLALAMLLRGRRPALDAEPRPMRLAPLGLALGFLGAVLAPLVVRALAPPGALDDASTSAALLRALLVAPAALCAGRLTRTLLLYVGVPKSHRLSLASAFVAGLCGAAAAGAAWSPPARTEGLALAVLAGLVVLLAATGAVARALQPEPQHEGLLAGPYSLLGCLLIGAGGAGIAALPEVAECSDVVIALAVLAAASLIFPVFRSNARRSGLILGACALIAAGAAGMVLAHGNADVRGSFLMVPAALLGLALPLVPRFYAAIPIGRKILVRIPPDRRRAPDGGVQRAALLVLGAAIGPASLVALGLETPFIDLLLIGGGGALVLFFDARAGIGRRLIWLGLSVTVFAVGLAQL